MGLLSSIFGKKDKDEAARDKAKPDFSNVRSGSSSTAREVPKPAPARPPAPAASPTAGPAAGSAGTTYEIKKGDTLSAIAQRHYGDAGKWRAIYEANRATIDDPDVIFPGQKITLPRA